MRFTWLGIVGLLIGLLGGNAQANDTKLIDRIAAPAYGLRVVRGPFSGLEIWQGNERVANQYGLPSILSRAAWGPNKVLATGHWLAGRSIYQFRLWQVGDHELKQLALLEIPQQAQQPRVLGFTADSPHDLVIDRRDGHYSTYHQQGESLQIERTERTQPQLYQPPR